MRRYRALLVAILAGALCSALILVYVNLHAGGGASAVELPTACDNFVEAANAFARHGSSSGVHGEQAIFAPDAADRPSDMLKMLLNACDEEFAASAR